MKKKIKVARGKTYRIEFHPSLDETGLVLGEVRFPEKLILIKSGQSKAQTILSVVHEIIHSLENEYFPDNRLTESQVEDLSHAIVSFLKINKKHWKIIP